MKIPSFPTSRASKIMKFLGPIFRGSNLMQIDVDFEGVPPYSALFGVII